MLVCTGAGSSEAVSLTEGTLVLGASKWRDLLNWKIGCAKCDGFEFDACKHPAGIGFLCVTSQRNDADFICTVRRENNRLQYKYNPESGPTLVVCLTELFGYACALGLEDSLTDGHTVAPRA